MGDADGATVIGGDAMARVLVTGATGFVPSNVVIALSKAGHEVIALHRSPVDRDLERGLLGEDGVADHLLHDDGSWRERRPRGRVRLRQGDVRDGAAIDDLFANHQPTHVMHMAAITPTVEMERERAAEIVETNELSTLHLLLASARHNVQRFTFLSSAAVYADSDLDQPIREDAPLRVAGGLYALTKIASERLCGWAAERLGIDTRIVRLGPAYGPWERPTMSRQRMSPVHQAVELALCGKVIRCNAPGERRDLIHVDDAARAITAITTTDGLPHRVYNLAGDNVSMKQMIEAVATCLREVQVEWVSSIDDANLQIGASSRGPLFTERLAADLGYSARYDLRSGIRHYINWRQSRPTHD